jgi:hypothetical protein
MKTKILLFLMILLAFSCADDECTEIAQIQYLGTNSIVDSEITRDTQGLIINEDTCFDGDTNIEPVSLRINGNAIVTVNGDLNVEGSILFVEDGTLNVTGSLIGYSNIFFLETGGTINVGAGILIGGDVTSTGGEPHITYCNFFQNQGLDSNIIVTQSCDPVTPCETLSDNNINSSLGAEINVACGYNYAGQSVKIDENGRQYIYIKL